MFSLSPLVNGNGQDEDDGKHNAGTVRRSGFACGVANEAHYWRDNTAANDGHLTCKNEPYLIITPDFLIPSEKMVGYWID